MLHNYKSLKELPTSVKAITAIGIALLLLILPLCL